MTDGKRAEGISMHEVDTKPTRTDLLRVIDLLQRQIGEARMTAANDRNPHRAAQVDGLLKEAHELCIQATRFDPPVKPSRASPWGRIVLTDRLEFV